MEVTPGGLSEYYASLSDEMLGEIDPAELTPVARKCYEREIEERGLAAEPAAEPPYAPPGERRSNDDAEVEADWLENAACACSYTAYPGTNHAPEAERARDALLAAGVPCELSVVSPEPGDDGSPQYEEYRVLVPEALHLKAIAVLDKAIFNADLETDWRTHFAALTDEQLSALRPEVICAGLLDRVERLTRVYEEEMERRGGG